MASGRALKKKLLGDARVAVVTTAAFFRPDQPPFDTSIRGGDYSYRIIPADTDLSTLNIAHRSDAFDHRGIESDKNLALPLDRLKSLTVRASSAPLRRVISASWARLPLRPTHDPHRSEVARMLVEDDVDAVVLTPV